MADPYVARDVDNNIKDPQPGDVEITDAFGNVFDNQNEYGVGPGLVAFYDEENVLKDPQPQYQNLGYVQYLVNNTPKTPAWEPDAAQWQARGVDNQLRTPEPYVRSPLFPDKPSEVGASAVVVTLRVEESEGLIVIENDTVGIRLEVNHKDYPSTANFDNETV